MVYLKLLNNYKANNSVENFLEDLVNTTQNSKFDANEFDTRSCMEFRVMDDNKMSKKEEETFMKNLRSSQKCRPSPFILILFWFYPDSVLILFWFYLDSFWFYPDFIPILFWFHSNFILISSPFYSDFILFFFVFYPDFIPILFFFIPVLSWFYPYFIPILF